MAGLNKRKFWTISLILILAFAAVNLTVYCLMVRNREVQHSYKDDPPGNIQLIHSRHVGGTTLSIVRILDDYFLVNANGGLLRIPPEVGKEMHIWSTEK